MGQIAAVKYWEIIADNLKKARLGFWVTYQPLIPSTRGTPSFISTEVTSNDKVNLKLFLA
jgi:hypothetical protein